MNAISRRFSRVGRRVSFALGATIFLAAVGLASVAQDLRTWKDASGQFSVKAKFVSVSDGVVVLEEEDGTKSEIELSKLCEADKKYVADRQKEAANPFRKKAADTPFRKKSGGSGMPSAPGATASPGAGREVQPDWSNVRTVAVTPANTEWKVPVGSAAPDAAPSKPKSVPLPPKLSFFEGAKGVLTNAAGTRAVVGYIAGDPGKKAMSRIVLCDLETGKALGSGVVPGAYVPLALNDAGDQVLVRTDDFGDHATLELWNLEKSGLKKAEVWTPYAGGHGSDGNDKDVRWAAFLDAKRFATVSEGGKLVIWRLGPVEPTLSLSLQSGCNPALSPDRKRMAFTTGQEIGILDTAEGDVLAVQPAPFPNMAWTSFAFSPSGKRLACQVFVNKVFIYEVADGTRGVEIPLQGLNPQVPTLWTDEGHLLIAGNTLVDLDSQVRLWQYQGADQVAFARGLCWFHVAPDQNRAGGLIPAKVPQNGAQEALAKALKDPNFFILKPGTSVSIDTSGIGDASQRGTVNRKLTENLAKNGIRVAPNSPVTVAASVAPGKEQEIAYRTMGAGFQVDKFKVRPQIGSIKFLYDGKVAWETGSSTVPFFDIAHLRKDESLQDHVRQFEKPNYDFFGHAELPKLLTRPTGQPTLGTSQVTLSGVR